MANMGMNIMNAVMSEWVGPRCSMVGMKIWMRMSMSGMTDRVRTSGMLIFVFSSFAAVLPEMYPRARWPTANDLFSSCCSQNGLERFNKVYSCGWVLSSC